MNPTTRRIHQTLYSLRKEFGGRIDVYELVSSTTDVITGVPVVEKNSYPVEQAIILPGTLSLREIRGISLISANKQLVQGGHWESIDKIFILDRDDLPSSFNLSTDDWIVHRESKYEIDRIQRMEEDAGLIVICKNVVGDSPLQIHHVFAETTLILLEGQGSGEL